MSDKPSYWQLLQDPRWQKKRLEILAAGFWRCSKCGRGLDGGSQFHAHHRYYVKDRMPWDYPNFAYEVLCDPCHKKEHSRPEVRAGWEVFMEAMCERKGYGIGFESIAAHILELRGPVRQTAVICEVFTFLMENKDAFRAHVQDAEDFHAWDCKCEEAREVEERRLGRELTEPEYDALIASLRSK